MMIANEQNSTLAKHFGIIKTIWSGGEERILYLEKAFLLILCFAMFVTPALWVRHFGGRAGRRSRKAWMESYVLIKMMLAVFALYVKPWTVCVVSSNVPFVLFIVVVGWLLVDVFINLAGFIFLRNFWQNPYSWNRSLILLMINFVEFTAWFACLYLALGLLQAGKASVTGATDAIYFSVVTATTVGYGDIVPTLGWGRRLVTVEVCFSLFFLATVVSYFVSNIGTRECDKEQSPR